MHASTQLLACSGPHAIGGMGSHDLYSLVSKSVHAFCPRNIMGGRCCIDLHPGRFRMSSCTKKISLFACS